MELDTPQRWYSSGYPFDVCIRQSVWWLNYHLISQKVNRMNWRVMAKTENAGTLSRLSSADAADVLNVSSISCSHFKFPTSAVLLCFHKPKRDWSDVQTDARFTQLGKMWKIAGLCLLIILGQFLILMEGHSQNSSVCNLKNVSLIWAL